MFWGDGQRSSFYPHDARPPNTWVELPPEDLEALWGRTKVCVIRPMGMEGSEPSYKQVGFFREKNTSRTEKSYMILVPLATLLEIWWFPGKRGVVSVIGYGHRI